VLGCPAEVGRSHRRRLWRSSPSGCQSGSKVGIDPDHVEFFEAFAF
jgi:hypothetical protein